MKRLILFSFVAVGLFLAGCSDQSSLVGPTQQISQQQGRTLIDLPVTSLYKSVKASEKIDGSVGGTIEFKGEITKGVEIHGTLVIPAGAFTGTKKISIESDKKTASFEFGPTGTFDLPLSFSATVTGLNLSGSTASFVYVDDNGNLTNITSDASGISDGVLYLVNAQLNHFSRYGWAK